MATSRYGKYEAPRLHTSIRTAAQFADAANNSLMSLGAGVVPVNSINASNNTYLHGHSKRKPNHGRGSSSHVPARCNDPAWPGPTRMLRTCHLLAGALRWPIIYNDPHLYEIPIPLPIV